MNSVDERGAWSPFSMIQPGVDNNANSAVVTDSRAQIRVTANPQALVRAVRGEYERDTTCIRAQLVDAGVIDAAVPEDVDDVEHWWKRGWESSLDYFQWSRSVTKGDAGTRQVESVHCVSEGNSIALPSPALLPGELSMGSVMIDRKSVRSYHADPLALDVLSSILRDGLRHVIAARSDSGSVKSGSLDQGIGHGLDFYVAAYKVDGIERGMYAYDIETHALRSVVDGGVHDEMRAAICGLSDAPRTSALTMLMVSDFERYAQRFPYERALRQLYIDAGRIAQDVLLVAGAHRVGVLVSPATDDRQLASLLRLDPIWQAPIYAMTMGYDKRFRSA